MDMVFQVAPHEPGEAAAPPPQEQDHKELDDGAEPGHETVDRDNDPDEDAVHDAGQELQPSGFLLVDEELLHAFRGSVH